MVTVVIEQPASEAVILYAQLQAHWDGMSLESRRTFLRSNGFSSTWATIQWGLLDKTIQVAFTGTRRWQ